jgi:NAD(P)-dependent dehydrogenase (short-subunit alcohol dehydrogenase family)
MLNGKVIVVTGGAGLLGRQFCSAIAEHGGLVVVADRDIAAAETVAADISVRYPGLAVPEVLDITSKTSVADLIARLQQRHGHVDAVVNNAYPRNRNYGRRFEDVQYEDFCENVGLHLGGYFLVSQQFALFFKQQGWGNIVNMSSIYGSIAPRFDVYEGTTMTMPVEYAGIKAAVVHLTLYLAQYFKRDGIRANCLSPGGIFDNQAESFVRKYNSKAGKKGMLDASDMVGALVFLLSDASKHMTGQNLIVDDGFSL